MTDIEAESFPSMVVREREGFNDLVTTRRLKQLADKITPDHSPGQAIEPQLPGISDNIAQLVAILHRLTFDEMMLATEGISSNMPEKSAPVVPFELALGMRVWAKSL